MDVFNSNSSPTSQILFVTSAYKRGNKGTRPMSHTPPKSAELDLKVKNKQKTNK